MRKQNLRLRVPSKLFMLAAILTLGFGNASCSRPKTPQEKENAAQDSTIAEETMTRTKENATTQHTAPKAESRKEKQELIIPGSSTDTETVTEFLKMFYARFVFDGESMDRVASDICTPKLLKYLEKQYDYDCLEAPCYAIWCFRTDMQDGPSDVSKVTDVIHENDGWFEVSYLDMGNEGVTRIHFIMQDGNTRWTKWFAWNPMAF